MLIRTWQFTNFNGLMTEPSIKTRGEGIEINSRGDGAEINWLFESNRILIEGVFFTGDETFQVMPGHVYLDGEADALVVEIQVNVIETDVKFDVGRPVPYEVDVELFEGFPETVEVTHLNRRGEEMLHQTSEPPERV